LAPIEGAAPSHDANPADHGLVKEMEMIPRTEIDDAKLRRLLRPDRLSTILMYHQGEMDYSRGNRVDHSGGTHC
jgi:hypothetical protein